MSDIIDENGLQLKNLTEIRDQLTTDLKAIYGDDINIEQGSPDGQVINIFSQAGVDLREVLTRINASFDPNQAEGINLDRCVSYNGIKRLGGSFTFTDVTVTTDRALNLIGLDGAADDIVPDVSNLYTVKDAEGNLFYLLTSEAIPGAGVSVLTFRAAQIGQVETTINTITNQETTVPGVTSVNNPTAANSTGKNEEPDSQLRERRSISVSLPAIGYLDSIEAAIRNLDGVTTAIVLENNTGVPDADGTPGHHIWAIVEGGDPDEIGEAIYKKKSSGSGMRGAQVVEVPRPDGRTFQANYDLVSNQDLYIRFSLSFTGVVDLDDLKRQIVEGVIWDPGAPATADTVTCFVKSVNKKYIITGAEISDDGASWLEVLTVASPENRFQNDVSRITIT